MTHPAPVQATPPPPYYQDDAVTIYHGDAQAIATSLPRMAAVITDPPYGIDATRMTLGTGKKNFVRGDWDIKRPSVAWLLALAPEVIVWGGNYFASELPVTNDWLCWHKKNDGLTFSEFELAWTNLGRNCRWYSSHWAGEQKQHPTQKPLTVMRWCVGLLAPSTGVILDPYMGSGTTLRAAKDLGRPAIGIEIDERYCEIAAERMGQEVLTLEHREPHTKACRHIYDIDSCADCRRFNLEATLA